MGENLFYLYVIVPPVIDHTDMLDEVYLFFFFCLIIELNMHRAQGSKVNKSKQEPWIIFLLTHVTLQGETFPTMYLVWL